MSESRLRDDQGRFVSPEEERADMNAMLLIFVGGNRTEPAPTPTANNIGQPVPLSAGPEPQEDENKTMNRCLMEMAGVPVDSR